MKIWPIILTLAAMVATRGDARAAFVSFNPITRRAPTPAEIAGSEIGGGVPADSSIYGFYLNSDSDILYIGRVKVTTSGDYYQHELGTDGDPPFHAYVTMFPAVIADSWITTPGATTVLGVSFPGDGTINSAWGDTSDNGPQTNFKFANLTFSPAGSTWRFSGTVVVMGTNGPESFAFEIPEPAGAALGVVAAVTAVALRQRRIHGSRPI